MNGRGSAIFVGAKLAIEPAARIQQGLKLQAKRPKQKQRDNSRYAKHNFAKLYMCLGFTLGTQLQQLNPGFRQAVAMRTGRHFFRVSQLASLTFNGRNVPKIEDSHREMFLILSL
ncbi:hypothetical protein ACFOSD_11750 [Salinispirillum marinum]|uniref:Uncharacterized protein n=2 Tax=Saccharospirillaceae TaxID=255527 RepID=A0ABV8BIJ2_9GAMM